MTTTPYQRIGPTEHRHRYGSQALVHDHPHDIPHGYFEHPEDGHPVTTETRTPVPPAVLDLTTDLPNLRCPYEDCGAATICERDTIVTWNPVAALDVEAGALVGVTFSQESGDREGSGYLCSSCTRAVELPDSPEIGWDWA